MKRHLLLSIALLALAPMASHTQPAAAARDPLYAVWLQTETGALPGNPQLAIDGAALAAFSRPTSGHARSEIVDVAGQLFGQAIRVHELKKFFETHCRLADPLVPPLLTGKRVQ